MQKFLSLLEAPSPAVLTTYRKDGTAVASPVWFRFRDGCFEVVIAENDVKLRHLAARPQCSIVVFEAVPPFRGVRIQGEPALTRYGADEARRSIPAGTSAGSGASGSPRSVPLLASCCGCPRVKPGVGSDGDPSDVNLGRVLPGSAVKFASADRRPRAPSGRRTSPSTRRECRSGRQ